MRAAAPPTAIHNSDKSVFRAYLRVARRTDSLILRRHETPPAAANQRRRTPDENTPIAVTVLWRHAWAASRATQATPACKCSASPHTDDFESPKYSPDLYRTQRHLSRENQAEMRAGSCSGGS